MCGHLSPVFLTLKYIAQCQEGTGGSFLPWDKVALGPVQCQPGEPRDEPGTCSPTLCPSHLKGKQSRNAPKRVSFGPVLAVMNPFPLPSLSQELSSWEPAGMRPRGAPEQEQRVRPLSPNALSPFSVASAVCQTAGNSLHG